MQLRSNSFSALIRRGAAIAALCALTVTAGATWLTTTPAIAAPTAKVQPATGGGHAAATPADDGDDRPTRGGAKKTVTGKLNLNTATAEQLVMLPGVGPSKADRVLDFRQKHGQFKRVADLRKVRGFGYKTVKKLEPYLDIKGDSTLQPQ